MARKLVVEIVGNSASFERSLARSGLATQSLGSKLGSLAKVAVVAAGAAGITALTYGLKKSVDAALQSEVSMAKLDAALKTSRISAKEFAGDLDAAQAKGREFGFTNIDVQAGLAKLVVGTHSASKSIADLGVAEDLARFKHISLADASQILVQAMVGSQRAVRQLGIYVPTVGEHMAALAAKVADLKKAHQTLDPAIYQTLKAQAQLADKQQQGNKIIDLVKAKLKGQAQAYSETAAGAMARFSASLTDIEEKIGQKLIPRLTQAVGFVNQHWPEIERVAATVAEGIGNGIAFLASQLQSNWGSIQRVAVGAFDVIKSAASGLSSFISGPFGSAFTIASGVFIALIATLSKVAAAIKTARVAMATLSLSFGPVGAIMAGLSVVAGIMAAQWLNNSRSLQGLDDVLKRVTGSFRGFKQAEDELRGAHVNLRTAQDQLVASQLAQTAAMNRATEAINKYGPNSQQAIQALSEFHLAQDQTRSSALALAHAQDDLATSQQKVQQQSSAGQKVLADSIKTIDSAAKATQSWGQDGWDATVKQLQGLEKLKPQLEGVVKAELAHAKALADSNPVAAATARATAGLAQKMLDLIAKFNAAGSKLSWKDFYAKFSELATRAHQAGVDATVKLGQGIRAGKGDVTSAMTQMMMAGNAAAVVAAANARRAGEAAAAGAAAGIRARAGDVSSAMTQMMLSAVANAQGAIKAHSPSRLTAEKLGQPAAEGIGVGFFEKWAEVQARITGATKNLAATTAAIAAQDWHKAGQNMGLMFGGGLASAAALTANAKAFADKQGSALTAELATLKGKLSTAVSNMLSAFNDSMANWKGPSQTLLDKMQLEDQIKQVEDAITSASGGIAQANTDLATALAGGDPAEIKKAQDAVLAAQDQYDSAVRAKQEFWLQQLAAVEQTAHDERLKKFQTYLDTLSTKFDNAPTLEAAKRLMEKITTAIANYTDPGGLLEQKGGNAVTSMSDGMLTMLPELLKAVLPPDGVDAILNMIKTQYHISIEFPDPAEIKKQVDAINAVTGGLAITLNSAVNQLDAANAGAGGAGAKEIPSAATGAYVKARPGIGTIIRVGEGRHDEIITPVGRNNGRGVLPLNGGVGGGVVINFNGAVHGDPKEYARELAPHIGRELARQRKRDRGAV